MSDLNLVDEATHCDGAHGIAGHEVGDGNVYAYAVWYWRPSSPEIHHYCDACVAIERERIVDVPFPEVPLPGRSVYGLGIRAILDHDSEPDHCQLCGRPDGGKYFCREEEESRRGWHFCTPECSWREHTEPPVIVRRADIAELA